MNDEIQIGIIGAGARCQVIMKFLAEMGPDIRIRSVYDPSAESVEGLRRVTGQPDIQRVDSYDAVTADPNISWVIIASPNAKHAEHILSAFKNGKHVFTEKPLATRIEDCRRIHEAHQTSDLHFATGFVLRYAPLAIRMKKELDSGKYGKIMQISANENITPAHGGYIMRGWRRFREESGPHILEKCCHDMDLLYWFTGQLPRKVSAFAGIDFFVPENAGLMKKYKKGDRPIFNTWEYPGLVDDPFTASKDIYDNYVAVMEFGGPIRVLFQATMSNAIPERRIAIQCTEGNLSLEFYSSTLTTQILGSSEPPDVFTLEGSDMHGGGDEFIMASLYDNMKNNTAPACSGREGLFSAVCALAIDQAAQDGQVLDLTSTWDSLNVSVDG